jgi:ribosomal protein S20
MSVTSLSSVDPSASDASAIFAERRKNMQALNSALQGGDLQAAQSAFAAVQKSLPQASTNVNASSPAGQLATGLQAVGQALQSGDLAGAQKAFAALQQNAQAAKSHGHHHHHHGGGGGATSTPSASVAATPTAAAAGTDIGTLLNRVG